LDHARGLGELKRIRGAAIVLACVFAATTAPERASALSDLAPAAGIAEITLTHGATVYDYDHDGDDDIVLSRHWMAFPRIWSANGDGTYTDLGDRFVGPAKKVDYHRCEWIDVQRDGLEDLFCAVGGLGGGHGPNPSQLWVANPNGTWSERAAAFAVDARWGRTYDATALDVNGDGWEDLYLGNLRPRADGHRAHNMLRINTGQGRFVSGSAWGADRILGSRIVETVDLNRDGRDDLLACGQEGLRVFVNTGRRLRITIRRRSPCRDAMLVGRRVLYLTRSRLLLAGRRARPIARAGAEFAVGNIGKGPGRDVYLVRKGPDLILYRHRHGFSRRPARDLGGRSESVAWVPDRRAFLVLSGRNEVRGRVALLAARH
jgi:FG-GAP-like repeat